MSVIAQLDRTKAKYSPADVFNSPEDIVNEIMMTRGEKLATLGRWAHDICHEMSAATEGMKTVGMADGLVSSLDSINAAIEQLTKPEASPES
jgi:hypothetical protein